MAAVSDRLACCGRCVVWLGRARHAHRVRRYARYGYYPYYGYYRWGSPSDHMARQLNAQQLYGGGWGGGPYSRSRYVPYD